MFLGTMNGGEHTKSTLLRIDTDVTRQLLWMSKSDMRLSIGLITGHCKLNDHMRKLRLRDDPDCDLCGRNVESARHIICECIALASIRTQTFGKPRILPEEICKYTIRKLLSFARKCSERNRHLSIAFG